MLCLCGFELYSRWVPLMRNFVLLRLLVVKETFSFLVVIATLKTKPWWYLYFSDNLM